MSPQLEADLYAKAEAIISAHKIYYGIKVTNVDTQKFVIYIEIPKNSRVESAKIASSLKEQLNELMASYGIGTDVYYFRVKYRTI